MKTLNLYSMIQLFSIILLLSSCISQAEPEIHLIPKGYKGYIIIIFDDKDGTPEKYENGSRVYEIPKDGVLRTRFKQQSGWIPPGKLKYYYQDNKRNELKSLPTFHDTKDDGKDYVFSKEISDGTVRYLVGKLSKGETYFKELRNKLEELFPPQVQTAKP